MKRGRRFKGAPSFSPTEATALRAFRVAEARELREQLRYYIDREGLPTEGGSLIPDLEEVIDFFSRQREAERLASLRYQLDSASEQAIQGLTREPSKEFALLYVDGVVRIRAAIANDSWPENRNAAASILLALVTKGSASEDARRKRVAEFLSSGLFPEDSRRGVRPQRAAALDEAGAIHRPDTELSRTVKVKLRPPGSS